MKAVEIKEFGDRNVLETVDIEEPSPNKGQVKIKLHVTGLNPNESYTISGTYSFVPELPYVPGYDGAGVIEEIGDGVDNFEIGDRVFLAGFTAERNTGTYAEKVVADAKRVYPAPDNLSMKEIAGLGIPAFAAYNALFLRAKIKAGEYVLIHGASGAVGSLAIQMAKAIGAIVIGTSSTEEGRKQILELGADHVMNHLSDKNKEELSKITGGKGPDVIIEILANENLDTDIEVIARYGRTVVVGSRDSIEILPRNLMGNESYITGMNVSKMTEEDRNSAYHGILAFIESGAVKPLIGKSFSLDEPVEAYKEMMEGSGNGRTIFEIAKED